MTLWNTTDTKESAPKYVVDTRNELTQEEMTGTSQYGETVFSLSVDEIKKEITGEIESIDIKSTTTELSELGELVLSNVGAGHGCIAKVKAKTIPNKLYTVTSSDHSTGVNIGTVISTDYNTYTIKKIRVNEQSFEILNGGTGYRKNDIIIYGGAFSMVVAEIDHTSAITKFAVAETELSYAPLSDTLTGGSGTGLELVFKPEIVELESSDREVEVQAPITSGTTINLLQGTVVFQEKFYKPFVELIKSGDSYADTTTAAITGYAGDVKLHINHELYVSSGVHAGWVRKYKKQLPDGTTRTMYETLVAGGSHK